MKKLLFLFLSFPIVLFSQDPSILNGYKWVAIGPIAYDGVNSDPHNIRTTLMSDLNTYGFEVYLTESLPSELIEENPCHGIYLGISHTGNNNATGTVSFFDCSQKLILTNSSKNPKMVWSLSQEYRESVRFALKKLLTNFSYKYDSTLNEYASLKKISQEESNTYEEEVRSYLDSVSLSSIEGIYDYASNGGSEYRVAIIKEGYKFIARVIESNSLYFKIKDKKAIFEPSAYEGAYTLKWTMGNAKNVSKTLATLKNGLIEFSLPGKDGEKEECVLYKMYPIISGDFPSDNSNNSWKGNGSGFFISTSGYIATNHHVIDKANKIEVEFILDGKVTSLNAKVIHSDKGNDLAIIQIDDSRFIKLNNIPYNFKTRSSDVGTEVYALGYPMALSIMGKEVKFTDGKISSKTGFQGNITTYQTTTPIQPGNSGGPLFDYNGNLIGINSAIIRTDVAENVSYSIKSSYLLSLIDVLPETISLPSSTKLSSKSLTEQIKILSNYVVLIKVK